MTTHGFDHISINHQYKRTFHVLNYIALIRAITSANEYVFIRTVKLLCLYSIVIKTITNMPGSTTHLAG